MRLSWSLVALVLIVACEAPGGPPSGKPADDDLTFTPAGGGHVTWTLGGKVFRIAAADGAAIEDVSAALAGPLPGDDRWLAPSTDGAFFALASERFSNNGEVLVRANAALDDAEIVLAGGAEVFLEGIPAINLAGDMIIYGSQGGPHDIDLFRTDRSGDGSWSAPQLLTGDSTFVDNNSPALTFNQENVLFDCGGDRAPESGATSSCEVGVDGTGFVVVVAPDALPNPRNTFTQFPHASTRGVVFQGSWPINGDSPETIWRLDAAGDPAPALPTLNNVVSPCGLPDGRMAVLFLDREGNPDGVHELTLIDVDDTTVTTLVPLQDVDDIGIGCSD